MKIRLYKATIDGLNWTPTEEEGGKLVLVITAPLNYKLAMTLMCDGLCFDAQGRPRSFEGKVGLEYQVAAASVELGDRIYEAQKIVKFRVGREKDAADSDPTLHVTMRMHFDGAYIELQEFCRSMNKGTFAVVIKPSQELLPGMDPDPDPDDKGADQKNHEADLKRQESGAVASAATMKKAGGKVN